MRQLMKILVVLSILWLMSGIVFASPATQPTTLEAAADVYVMPFIALGGDHSLDWAGRAVQQNLLTDLARNQLLAVAADTAPGKDSGARYFVSGTYQLAEQLVRFNGQLIDVKTGNVIGGISATGAPRDLFSLEDSLSSQLLRQLAPLPVIALGKPAGQVPVALQPPALAQVIQPPAVAQVGAASSYQGSALQQYVDANRTPSTDYAQQVQDAQYRNTFGSYNSYFGYGYGGAYSPFYFGGGYGYGLTYTFGRGGYFGGYGGGFYGGYRQHIVNADR